MSAIKYTNEQDFNKNQIRNVVIDNQSINPSSPLQGQVYYNSESQRLGYWSGTSGVNNGLGWIFLGGGTAEDNYVDSVTFSTTTGFLTLGRTGALADLSVNLNGRYLTQNQTITLTGDIEGSGTTTIYTEANKDLIVNKTSASTYQDLASGDTLLFYDEDKDELRQSTFQVFSDYLNSQLNIPIYQLEATVSNPTGNADIVLSSGFLNYKITLAGTTNEVEVNYIDASRIQIGLPNDVVIGNNLTVTGNLIVNGTQTIINTDELKVEDNIIALNSNVTGTPIVNAGVEVNRGSSPLVSILWNETTDRWTFTNNGTNFYNIPIPSEYSAYAHPTQAVINVDGSGLQFIQDINVNTLGHVTSATLGTIPTASTTVTGVTRLATNTEVNLGASGVALQPSQVTTMLQSRSYVTTITGVDNTAIVVDHNLGTNKVMVQLFDTETGETFYSTVTRVDDNRVEIIFGLNAPTEVTVLIIKVV